MRYSLLDLAPVPEGSDTVQALRNMEDLAIRAEDWGYHRYWLAEHHNMPGIASAATAVLIGHIAARTSRMRVGAGGIMLPNHAPLAVAETFGTLETLHPGRIDLGLGRAPGGDQAVMQALGVHPRRAEQFSEEVGDLGALFGPARNDMRVNAHPGQGTQVPLWILGSSLYGATVAAEHGLPYAFASHFAPAALEQAFARYREGFRPSAQCNRPHAMLAINVFAAESDAEAQRLKTSMQQAFYRLRTGQAGKLPPPVDDIGAVIPAGAMPAIDGALAISATGSPDTVARELRGLIQRHRPDEVILVGQIHDHAARLRSFEIAAQAMAYLPETVSA